MSADIVIVGVGMATSVGLSAPETAASVRAGVMRFAEVSIRDSLFEPFVAAEIPDDGLPSLEPEVEAALALTHRERRLLRLGTMPLLEALGALPRSAPKPPLALALPGRLTTRPLDSARFLECFALQTARAFDLSRSSAEFRGRAGGLLALEAAASMLGQDPALFVVAGGIDTFLDPYVLGILHRERRVKTSQDMDGFVPGEGAGFLLLTTAANAARLHLPPLAGLSRVSTGVEPGHLYSGETYRGDGLASTLSALFASAAISAPVREVFSSMNGENHWAKEWGVARLRNTPAFDPAAGMHHPADCFGDTGAASGPLLVGLAALGILQNYRRPPALVTCSADDGPRAAVAVERA